VNAFAVRSNNQYLEFEIHSQVPELAKLPHFCKRSVPVSWFYQRFDTQSKEYLNFAEFQVSFRLSLSDGVDYRS